MADRCRGPRHERVAEEGWTREAPVDPGCLAAAFRHRRHARALLEGSGGRKAFALLPTGDEEAGSADRASAWEDLEQGEGRMALRVLCESVVDVLDRVQGDPELTDEGLHEPGRGAMMPASVVKGVAALLASLRGARTSAERTWGARKQVSRVEPRARCTALRVGQRLSTSPNRSVSWSCNHGRACGKEFFRGLVSRWVLRTVSPTTRRRCATRGARARLVGLCGVRGCSLSRCVHSQARWRAASVGAALAWLGVNAARERARVRGWTGKRTRKSSVRKAKTMGPLVSARQTAIGVPANRWRRVHTPASRASGVCSRMQCARVAEPAACQHPSGVASAQSRPTKAAQTSCVSGSMSALPRCGTVVSRDMRAGVLRRHEREPRQRQTLRMRGRTQAHPWTRR